MAHCQTCIFCGKNSINHDHDACIQAYGDNISEKLFEHATRTPTELIPRETLDLMKGEKWDACLKYLERCKSREALAQHLNMVIKDVDIEMRAILSEPENLRRIMKHVTDFESRALDLSFTIDIYVTPKSDIAVSVT